jgi:hypothetical protein
MMMPAIIGYHSTNINYMSRGNAFYNGEVISFGFSSHQKQNYFNEPIGLLNYIPWSVNWNVDPDFIDSPINDQDAIGSFGNRQI